MKKIEEIDIIISENRKMTDWIVRRKRKPDLGVAKEWSRGDVTHPNVLEAGDKVQKMTVQVESVEEPMEVETGQEYETECMELDLELDRQARLWMVEKLKRRWLARICAGSVLDHMIATSEERVQVRAEKVVKNVLDFVLNRVEEMLDDMARYGDSEEAGHGQDEMLGSLEVGEMVKHSRDISDQGGHWTIRGLQKDAEYDCGRSHIDESNQYCSQVVADGSSSDQDGNWTAHRKLHSGREDDHDRVHHMKNLKTNLDNTRFERWCRHPGEAHHEQVQGGEVGDQEEGGTHNDRCDRSQDRVQSGSRRVLAAARRLSGIKPGLVQSKISNFLKKFPGLAKAEPKIKIDFNPEKGASGERNKKVPEIRKRKLCSGVGDGGVDLKRSSATKRIRH